MSINTNYNNKSGEDADPSIWIKPVPSMETLTEETDPNSLEQAVAENTIEDLLNQIEDDLQEISDDVAHITSQ